MYNSCFVARSIQDRRLMMTPTHNLCRAQCCFARVPALRLWGCSRNFFFNWVCPLTFVSTPNRVTLFSPETLRPLFSSAANLSATLFGNPVFIVLQLNSALSLLCALTLNRADIPLLRF